MITYILGFLTLASFVTSWASWGWAGDAIPEGEDDEPSFQQIQEKEKGNNWGFTTLITGILFLIFWLIALAAT